MRIDDIIRAGLKALEEGDVRQTNTAISARGALVSFRDLLHDEPSDAEPFRDPFKDSSPYNGPPEMEQVEYPFEAELELGEVLHLHVATHNAELSEKENKRRSALCKNMANETESSTISAVFALSSQKLQHLFFHEEHAHLFSSVASNAAIAGLALRLCVEQPLSRMLRNNEGYDEQTEEFSLFFAGMYCFVSLVPERDVALVLIMNEKSQQGRSWFALREATQKLLVGEGV